MKVECAWCGKFMGYKKGGNPGDVTHGMCRKCYKAEMAKVNKPKSTDKQ